MKKTS